MKLIPLRFFVSIVLAFVALVHANGQDDESSAGSYVDEIDAVIKSYVAAYNSKDVEQLAAHWSPDGVFTNPNSGVQISGRDAIVAEFTEMFSDDEDEKLAIETESIELISPSVALERGLATVTRGTEAESSRYRVVYVKVDNNWLVDRVTEDESITTTPSEQHLQQLDWLIGDWSDQGEGFSIDMNCAWTTKRNFITRTFKVTTPDGIESTGIQVIGWDAKEKQIRSWLFDSDGSVITGKWHKNDDGWTVQSVATLSDGSQGSFTSVFEPLDDGNYAWRKVNRVLDGNLLPNIDQIVVQRK